MSQWLKQLFCRHKWVLASGNMYGDSRWFAYCQKCGKLKAIKGAG